MNPVYDDNLNFMTLFKTKDKMCAVLYHIFYIIVCYLR